jgi:hypothetical protein
VTTQTSVAGYGRYAQITIVRVESDTHTPREYGERFYILVDRNNQRIGRSFHYLRNARKEAARLARKGDL